MLPILPPHAPTRIPSLLPSWRRLQIAGIHLKAPNQALCANRKHSKFLKNLRYLAGLVLGLVLTAASPASAQTGNGFQLNRYTPTAAGEWSFWVNHPWYSSTRYFAAGVTFDYAHNPLVFGTVNSNGTFDRRLTVVEHQFIGHVDLAGSFYDAILATLSLPIIFVEKGGTPAANAAAGEQVSVGDLRLGAMFRVFGQPYRGPISLSIGADLWVPWRQFFPNGLPATSSDTSVRGLPRIVLGGLTHKIMWSFTAGVLLRPHAILGDPGAGAEANSELQFGAAIAYANTNLRLAVGPEIVAATAITGDNAFKIPTTNVEALVGVHYNVAKTFQLGLGGGLGILRQAGTPDGRVLLRLAYAPWPKDKKPEPPKDRDHDGVIDAEDLCPDEPQGSRPEPSRPGCPMDDRDKDGVLDGDDLCPDEPQGCRPDPQKKGCPMGDRDKDGVLDGDDLCPDEARGQTPDPMRQGCPSRDRDNDGVFDAEDKCPDVHQGPTPDPIQKGCPAGDRDKDTILDPYDACPDQPGAPNADPKKNGCPGLVKIEKGQIDIVKPVFFATNKDVILKQSFEVLQSVADTLVAAPQIKKVRIEGHTDNRGKVAHNTDLSARRARSVMRWLVDHSIAENRLEAQGYGPQYPIADNKTAEGRAKNRRVVFLIVDPPQPASVKTVDAASIEVPKSSDQSDVSSDHKPAKDDSKAAAKKTKAELAAERKAERQAKREAAKKAKQEAKAAAKEKAKEKAQEKAAKAKEKAQEKAEKAKEKAAKAAERKAQKKAEREAKKLKAKAKTDAAK